MYCRCYYEFLLSSQTNHIKYYHSQYRNEEIQAGNMKMKKDRVEGISLNLHSRKTAKMGFNFKPLIQSLSHGHKYPFAGVSEHTGMP